MHRGKCHINGSALAIINTLRPRQNGRRFADDIFKYIFLNENVRILAKLSLKFVPEGPIDNIPALVQIMAWRRPGDKPLSETMMVRLPTHICVTRPQWVNSLWPGGLVKMGRFYHHIDVTEVLAISRRFGGRLWIFIGAHGLLRVLTFIF